MLQFPERQYWFAAAAQFFRVVLQVDKTPYFALSKRFCEQPAFVYRSCWPDLFAALCGRQNNDFE